jgi:4-hydroxy-3-methylbut-2-enyl diphosphate reductase
MAPAQGKLVTDTVQPDSYIALHYRVANSDDIDFVSTFGTGPATLQLGTGELAPMLERCIIGIEPGQRHVFLLDPDQAFGAHNPQLVQRIGIADLPAGVAPGTARSDRIRLARRRQVHRHGARTRCRGGAGRFQPSAGRQGHPFRSRSPGDHVMDILLANPRGFCAGVERAIAIVERALEKFGAPIYVRHEVVHNRYVVDGLKAKGAVFVEELAEVPDGATVIFSAHGVPQSVRREAEARGLRVYDATCPLVTKVHMEVARLHQQGFEIIMIGHKGHPEVEGTMGQATGKMYLVENIEDVARLEIAPGNVPPLAYVTQTTLSVDDARVIVHALNQRFPAIVGPRKDDICYATQNRQDAVKALVGKVDRVIVVGSRNSSNSNRLREVAAISGVPAYLVDGAEQIDPAWLDRDSRVGVTAGASAPEVLVNGVVDRLKALGALRVETLDGVPENINFPIPRELSD